MLATDDASVSEQPILEDVAHLLERLATDLGDADVAVGLRLALSLIRSRLGDVEELRCDTRLDAC